MPIHNRFNKQGYYFVWGNNGKKYYYNPQSDRSKKIAFNKALKQAQAAHANRYKK